MPSHARLHAMSTAKSISGAMTTPAFHLPCFRRARGGGQCLQAGCRIISQGDNFFVLHLLNETDLQTLKKHNVQ
jgi:hypothetical protein